MATGATLAKEYLIDKPFGRGQETDADKKGIDLMIKAGYDPKYAITFWEKMAKRGGGKPQFLSTHPSKRRHRQKWAYCQQWIQPHSFHPYLC